MLPLVARLTAVLAALGLAAVASASDALIKPGRLYAVIDSEHLHVLVPAHAVDKLKPFVARAELIYCRIARDAGYRINGRLTLLLSDDAETHNGYSTTVPEPIVDLDIPSATQESFIFSGDNWLERTLTHELTHHVSNDREPDPILHTMEEIFGRILPNDDLSLIVAFFTIPAHATMPSFWQEGCAQWTETAYAPPNSVWGGRGRDSLTHMMWRLAAASPTGIPTVDQWRLTWPRWPYGNMVYIWGMGYLRYLDAAYGDRATIWQLIEREEHRWPFCFNGGPRTLLGKDHLTMINEERAALQREQDASLATLRAVPVTETRRMTPVDAVVSSPAWTKDGQLFAAYQSPYFNPCYLQLAIARDGGTVLERTSRSAWAMGDARSLADGTLIYSETYDDVNPWNRLSVTVLDAEGGVHHLGKPRMLQPDIRAVGPAAAHQVEIVGLHLLPAAEQEIALFDAHLGMGLFSTDRERGWRVVPTQGNPWSPAFRRGHNELSWVETDPSGSRLILAPLADLTARTVLAQVRGRILLPSWSADGSQVFICADHSGVANAYCIEADHPGTLIPVTNTIGGVLACVPSFDGKRLGVVDCDLHGPYLSVLPMDRSTWATRVPSIPLPFPAPLTPEELQIAHSPGPDARAGDEAVLTGRSRWSVEGQPAPGAASTAQRIHIIEQGETLADISRQYYGTTQHWKDIVKANPAIDPDVLPVGQQLVIPALPALAAAQSPAAANATAGPVGAAPVAAAPAAPQPGVPAGPGTTWSRPDGPGDVDALKVSRYHGLFEIQPLFWAPTTLAVPTGGYGVYGVAADPIFTHELTLGVGAGPENGQPVGQLSYVYGGWPLDIGVIASREQLYYDKVVVDAAGNRYSYAEDQTSGMVITGYDLNGLDKRTLAYVGAGVDQHSPLDKYTKVYQNLAIANPPSIRGREEFVEGTIGYDDRGFFPTSYTYETGEYGDLTWRHSRYADDSQADSVFGVGQAVATVWPSQSHQLVFAGELGWNGGRKDIDNEFTIGGLTGVGLPRGYPTTVASGSYLVAASGGYQLPVWRPFSGFSTSPWVFRQLTVTGFFDIAKVSSNRLGGDGHWYKSVGGEVHADWEFWTALIDPGFGVARQLDATKQLDIYLSLSYGL